MPFWRFCSASSRRWSFYLFWKKGFRGEKSYITCTNSIKPIYVFYKNEVKILFEQKGLDPIYTRIGVDFGGMDDVLWAMAGVDNISEIATYSLYTSLASKMQGYAKSNQIIIGKNIIDTTSLDISLYEPVDEKGTFSRIENKDFIMDNSYLTG